MERAEPARIEYCSLSGEILEPTFDYPIGRGTSFGDCEALARHLLVARWRREGDALIPMISKPHSKMVRVVTDDGKVICQWSVDDERSMFRAKS
jgi:hypothetical protein